MVVWGFLLQIRHPSNEIQTKRVMNPITLAPNTKGVHMSMADVLRSIKDAEKAASDMVESSKEESTKILADARKKASELIAKAQDEAISSTTSTLDSARSAAGKEAESVQSEGAGVVDKIASSASDRRDTAVKILLDSLMSN